MRSDKHLFDGLTCAIFIRSLLRVVTYLLVVTNCEENEVSEHALAGRDCVHYQRLKRWFGLPEKEEFSINVAFYNFVILLPAGQNRFLPQPDRETEDGSWAACCGAA